MLSTFTLSPNIVRLLPVLAFAAIAVALGFSLTNDPRKMPSQMIDKPAPVFQLPQLDGKIGGLATDDLRGQVSLINVFASWCAGCRVEHPTLLRIQRDNKVPLFGINWKDKPGDGQKWLNANRSPYLKVGDDSSGRLGIDLGVTGVPETFVIDKTGRIRYRYAGPVTDEVWTANFEPLLADLRKER
jgi:cytochrome c biogenesis protein CcmG, thiol:disulfide interchange protein DsbE